MRGLIKQCAGRVLTPEWHERLLAHSLLQQHFHHFRDVPKFQGAREQLWEQLKLHVPFDQPTLFLEFGVFEGYSIKWFARHLTHSSSELIGCDSFEGLPENWVATPRGTFSTGGIAPETDDRRVRFIKGWFQETSDQVLTALRSATPGTNVIVHLDADLYSSTLYVLATLHRELDQYYCIFDEFMTHEIRAAHNYVQAFGAELQILGAAFDNPREVSQVLAKIVTNRAGRPER